MANETADMKEVVFCTYLGTIKNPMVEILKLIRDEYPDYYKDYIDLDRLWKYSDDMLLAYTIQSDHRNVLYEFIKRDFDVDGTLRDLYDVNRTPLLFFNSEELMMYRGVSFMIKESFTSNVVFYTPTPDVRIMKDIEVLSDKNTKVEYISGGFIDAVKSVKDRITTFILNDIELLPLLIENNLVKFSNVLVANYGYNYKDNPEDPTKARVLKLDQNPNELERIHKFRLRMFEVSHKYELIDVNLENNIELMNINLEVNDELTE